MPGPCNSKKKKKQQNGKEKGRAKRTVLKEVERNVPTDRDTLVPAEEPQLKDTDSETRNDASKDSFDDVHVEWEGKTRLSTINSREHAQHAEHQEPQHQQPQHVTSTSQPVQSIVPSAPSLLQNPFITDPGNGPRVKDTAAFLSSFFCPPPALDDAACAAFAREEVLTVLEAVLPREVCLIVWYNKTRKYGRICPACQRLYRLGDSLVDPVSGAPVDVRDPQTPPQVLREQQLSGICMWPSSLSCFLLSAYTSHPYVHEITLGAWGRLHAEIDAQTRALLDATDPRSAALLRYGLAVWEAEGMEKGMEDQGLGRAMRMTRKENMGLGEVLEALAWYEEEKRKEREEDQNHDRDKGGDRESEGMGENEEDTTRRAYSPPLNAPTGIRA
ncbi:hypothetical protein DFH11DRAFT_1508075 [Phellopilus nigrolimitatus]|nr:hypothetical protein DFH11DRAFT_1508075 [Phellopilus nigrolimitatus]